MYIATRRAHLEAREAGFLVLYNQLVVHFHAKSPNLCNTVLLRSQKKSDKNQHESCDLTSNLETLVFCLSPKMCIIRRYQYC